jgi:hypothetical protein
MKKNQLIETGILAVALICGYKFFDSLISTAITTLYQFAYGYGDAWTAILQYLILAAIYFGFFILLIRKRSVIANFIDKQGQEGSAVADDDQFPINIHQNNLLFVIIIALCLITLITEVPSIVIGIYSYFKKEVSGTDPSGYNSVENLNFKAAAIKVVITVIVLGYAKQISHRFSKSAAKDDTVATTLNLPE